MTINETEDTLRKKYDFPIGIWMSGDQENFAPLSVIVSERGDVLYVLGQTGKFLETAQGRPGMLLTDVARRSWASQAEVTARRSAGPSALLPNPSFSLMRG